MRKRHIRNQNEIILTEAKQTVKLNLEKSSKLFGEEIIFDIGFARPKSIPENILYTVIYKDKNTGQELESPNTIENIHSDVYKSDYWKMPFKKQIGGLIANSIVISVTPFTPCDFWLKANEIPAKF